MTDSGLPVTVQRNGGRVILPVERCTDEELIRGLDAMPAHELRRYVAVLAKMVARMQDERRAAP